MLAFGPIWIWSSMMIEAILGWHTLGRWPVHAPYPANIRFHQFGAEITAAILCATLAGAVSLAARQRPLKWRLLTAGAGLLVLWLTAYLLLRFDPGGVVGWALD